MYRRTIDFIRNGLCRLKLRVKYQIGFRNLPALATHLVCFLGGTLLFEPDTRGKVPTEMLVPWPLSKVTGGVQVAGEYQLVAEGRGCVLFSESFRLWRPEDKRIFLILPKQKKWAEVTQALQKSDTRLYRKEKMMKPQCQKTSPHVTIYP